MRVEGESPPTKMVRCDRDMLSCCCFLFPCVFFLWTIKFLVGATTSLVLSSLPMEKQKESPQLRCIEFYSGIGGLHHAFLLTECEGEVVAAYDLNNLANAIYEHNFPSCKVKTVCSTARQGSLFHSTFFFRRSLPSDPTLFFTEKPGNCDRQRTRWACGQRLAYVPPLSGLPSLVDLSAFSPSFSF